MPKRLVGGGALSGAASSPLAAVNTSNVMVSVDLIVDVCMGIPDRILSLGPKKATSRLTAANSLRWQLQSSVHKPRCVFPNGVVIRPQRVDSLFSVTGNIAGLPSAYRCATRAANTSVFGTFQHETDGIQLHLLRPFRDPAATDLLD